jgi:hypothetical protein
MDDLHHQHVEMNTSDASWMPASPWFPTFLAGLLVVIGVSVAAGAAEASHYQISVLALAIAAVIAAFACVRPDLFGVALVATLLVPFTWSPTVTNAPAPPMVLFALPASVAAAFVLRKRLRLCALDYLVGAIFASALLSELATSGQGILGGSTLTRTEFDAMLLPYVAFRLIATAWPVAISKLPDALTLTGAALCLFALWEELRGSTLFAASSFNNPQLTQWEINYPRAGGVRAQATMGHPLALGSFLVIPLVIAFAQRRWRLFGLLAVGEALTLSRGPYIAAIVTLFLWGIVTRRIGRLWILLTVIGVLALFVGPVRNSVTNSFQTGTTEQRNADYRSQLLSTSLGSLTLWGKPTGQASELYGQNLSDVTSEFAFISGRQGVLGIAIWIGLLAAFVYTIREARRRRDPLLLILGVALVGEWIALLSVPLITSFQDAFWLTVAMSAARLTQRTRSTENLSLAPHAERGIASAASILR